MIQETKTYNVDNIANTSQNSVCLEEINHICKIFVNLNLFSVTVSDLIFYLGYNNDDDFGVLMIQLGLSFGFENGLIESINDNSYILTDKGWELGLSTM